ncbi:MAG: peptidase associated/transthyretin-like domain-containing protein [Planctomycetota bacterium]|jgi:hypothetical protein
MASLTLSALHACNTNQSNSGDNEDTTCDPQQPDCSEGLVCEIVNGTEEGLCTAPLIIRGVVVDIENDMPIEGALVQAVDVNGGAVGTSGQTDAEGAYELTVPAIRDENGNPINSSYTLRAQASSFQGFPTPIRPALPLVAETAQVDSDTEGDSEESAPLVIENTLTTIKLIALPGDTSILGSISGSIEAEFNAGLLVVAEGDDESLIGFSDSMGVYTIFNVPAGSYRVQGYAAGVQLESESTTLAATEMKTGVDLVEAERPLNSIAGSVQIVNAPGGLLTSVVLAVESTFEESTARGEVPPGLRVGEIDGAFTIENIPDGDYVLLAAFENDDLVRDPDESISGTQIVHLTVPDPDLGNDLTFSDGFKITEALGVVGPGSDGPEQVMIPTPTLEWADDSSEDGYEIDVFDAFGNLVWSTESESVSGSETIQLAYGGPPLQNGMFYQFKVTSFRERNGPRTAISTTEGLRGVFYYLDNEGSEP